MESTLFKIDNHTIKEIDNTVNNFKTLFNSKKISPFFHVDDLNKRYVLSVSGGVDSMVLLINFILLQRTKNINFSVINFEHGIRQASSVIDSYFVKKFCDIFCIQCEIREFAILENRIKGKGLEQQAREYRHAQYKRYVENGKTPVLAHTKDDSVESIMMHIIRGTGLQGLKGMQTIENGIYRPMLALTKKDILDFAREIALPFRQDESNYDNSYTRNYLRNEILPRIEKINSNITEAIISLSDNVSPILSYIEEICDKKIKIYKNHISFSSNLKNEKMAKECIKLALRKIDYSTDIEKKHLASIIELSDLENGKQIDLPNGGYAYKEREQIFVYKKKEKSIKQSYKYSLENLKGLTYYTVKKVHKIDFALGGCFFDRNKLDSSFEIRTRENGDMFETFTGKIKNLSDFLTNKKVPKDIREKLYVIAKDNVVYAILGIEVSKSLKVENKTKNIINVTFRR